MAKKNIILWEGNRARLYCSHTEGDRWHVINGNWTLLLSGLTGIVEATKQQIVFTKKTIAPVMSGRGHDIYNEVMVEAERQENAKATTK